MEGLYQLCSETEALISFAVNAKLICVFVFAYAKSRFSHDEAQIISIAMKAEKYRISDTASVYKSQNQTDSAISKFGTVSFLNLNTTFLKITPYN